MDMHWLCCECDATNVSQDDEHLVCSHEDCDHHLCSDCYNPQQIGRIMHLNAQVATTGQSISKSIVSQDKYDEHRRRRKTSHVFRNARKVLGHHIKHSKIGKAFLSFWSYVQRKTGMKKEKLRIEGKKMPTVVVKTNTESLPSTSHFYQPEEITEYRQESYYYGQQGGHTSSGWLGY